MDTLTKTEGKYFIAKTISLTPVQRTWVENQAEAEGHHNVSRVIQRLIDDERRRKRKRADSPDPLTF